MVAGALAVSTVLLPGTVAAVPGNLHAAAVYAPEKPQCPQCISMGYRRARDPASLSTATGLRQSAAAATPAAASPGMALALLEEMVRVPPG